MMVRWRQSTGLALVVAAAAAGAAELRQPVQLCGCAAPGTRGAAQQTWDWGPRSAASAQTKPSPVRLRANRTLCLHAGAVTGRAEPQALFVAECSSAPNLTFVPKMKRLNARDTSVLQQQRPLGGSQKTMCVDAAGMSERLQLYACIDDDNDQQYAGIDGVGTIVDLWTGFSNCVGVAGPDCAAPRLLPASTPPAPAPAPAPPRSPSGFAERWCPRYHASRGTDPSGALIFHGETFIFPDGSDDNTTIPPHHYGTKDLLTWTRYPMGWEGDTGSITVTSQGIFRMWPQGGAAGAIARARLLNNDSMLSNWSKPVTAIPVPNGVKGKTVANFRDPSRAVQLSDGHYYLAVGSDDGNNTGLGTGITADGVAAMRLFRSADDSLQEWTDVGMPFVAHATQGYVNYSSGAWSPNPVTPAPFLECPDLFRSSNLVVMVASYNDFAGVPMMHGQDGMSAEWRTGGFTNSTDGSMRWETKHSGVLDYGAYYAQKTAGEALTPNEGRRVLFAFTGWHERTGGSINAACGISHLMPRDLSVAADGRLQIAPVPEIGNLKLGASSALKMDGEATVVGSQVMVSMICTGVPEPPRLALGVVPPRARRAVGIDILLDAAAGEWTRVGYDLDSGVLFVDQSHTNAHNPALSDAYQTTAPLQTVTGSATSTLNITVLVDGGLVESYANDHVVISSLLSPSTNGSIAAEMRSVRAVSTGRSTGSGDTVTSTASCTATAWKMRSIGN